ncbi:MAG: DUF615 domain-containing protein [Gammaproteobacteria bacterium]|nr:DUF615 domain-containing protein [Gammaproteobacteria bacterium]
MTEDNDELVSKSQLKREAHAIREMGERLVAMPEKVLVELGLPDNILEAVREARSIRSYAAKKRQFQYLGKLLRGIDVEPIAQELARYDDRHHQNVEAFHEIEHWRDRLLGESGGALEELISQYPDIDVQHLRQLIRNNQRERAANKPPKSARAIFQYLKQIIIG